MWLTWLHYNEWEERLLAVCDEEHIARKMADDYDKSTVLESTPHWEFNGKAWVATGNDTGYHYSVYEVEKNKVLP